jgi:hypothetical protein
MSKRIAAGNIRLRRAYESAGSGDGTRILIDRLWPRGSERQLRRSICGPRTLLPAQRCGGGSDMIPHVGRSFDAATRQRYTCVGTGSANYVPSLKEDGSHSFLQPMMKFTTTPSF